MTLRTLVSPEARAAGDGDRVCEFVDAFGVLTTTSLGGNRGDAIDLRDWQRDLIADLYARDPLTGKRLFSVALVAFGRKNGKSLLGALVAIYELFMGVEGGQIYSVAASKEQASIVFDMAVSIIKASPDLLAEVDIYRRAIHHRDSGTIYRVISSDAAQAQGLDPTCVIFDELAQQFNASLWGAMNLGSATRVEPLILAITTAGPIRDSFGEHTVAYETYLYGKATISGDVVDPSFFMAWYEPENPDADHRDPETWRAANPGYGDFASHDDFEANAKRMTETAFRMYRTNQWVSSALAWLPHGAWDARTDALRSVPDKTPVVIAFDGSFNGDASALIGCTVTDPHLFVIDIWERPADADDTWRVPVAKVRDTIRAACSRYDVLEVSADPHLWIETLEGLAGEGLPVVEWTNSPARNVAATQRLYEAVMNGTVTHDGDSRLRRHVDSCAVKTDRFGPRVTKDSKNSARKIDAAVAALMAFDRAAQVVPSAPYSWTAF